MIATGSSWLVASRASQAVIAMLGIAVLARLLSPREFGVMAISSTPILLLAALTNGLFEIPTVRENDLTDQSLRRLVWSAFAMVTVAAGVIWFAAPLVERLLDLPQLASVMRGRIPFAFVFVVASASIALLRRAHRFRAVSALAVINISIYVLLTAIMALNGLGVWSMVLGHLASITVTAMIAASLAKLSLRPPRSTGLGAVGRQAFLGALSRAVVWGWSNIDTVAVGAALGPAATGFYSRASSINHHLKEPIAALDSTLRQALAILNTRGGGHALQLDQTLRMVTLGAAFIAAGVVVARGEIVAVLLGSGWEASIPIVALLAMGLPARGAVILLDGLATSVASVGSMVARNVALLVLIGAGVLVAAPMGAPAVAAVVTVALYIAVLLPVGAASRGTTLVRMIRAMAPGLLAGVLLAAGGELIASRLPEEAIWLRIGVLAVYFGTAFAAIATLLPDAWIGGPIASLRRTVYRRVFFKPPDVPEG